MRLRTVVLVVLFVAAGPVAGAVVASPAGGWDDGRLAVEGAGHTAGPGPNAGLVDRTRVDGSARWAARSAVVYTYRLVPDDEHAVEVTVSITDTSGLRRISTSVYDPMTVTGTDGFEPEGDDYEWDGRTAEPRLTYRVNLTQLDSSSRGGDWAVVVPGWAAVSVTAWSSSDDETFADLRDRQRVAAEGEIYDNAVVLGDFESAERTVDGHLVRVVVPGDQRPRYGTDAGLDVMANASRTLSTGPVDPVTAIVTPSLGPLTTGSTVSDGTFLVYTNASAITWFHEYVHTRQVYTHRAGMRWFSEGSAQYYGYQLALQTGYADAGDFDHMLLQTHDDRSVLAEPDTWEVQSEYHKGASVIALLDRQIRTETDGEATFRDVFRRLNAMDDAVTVTAFVDAVRAVGGDDVAETARRYVTTDAVPPDRWDAGAYQAAYGYEPADISVGLESVSGLGPQGNRTLAVDAQDLTVTPGERVTFRFAARNSGGMEGHLSVRTDVSLADPPPYWRDVTGGHDEWLAPDERTTWTVEHTFDEAGEYHVTGPGAGLINVHVVRPNGTATATGLRTVGTPVPGEPVELELTVRNEGEHPANETFPVRVDGERVGERSVLVNPGAFRRVTVTVQPLDAGEHTVSIGGAETTVVVDPGTPTPTPTATSVGTGDPTTTDDVTETADGEAAGTPTAGATTAPPADAGESAATTAAEAGDDGIGAVGPGFGTVGGLVALVALVIGALGRRR